MSAFLRKYVMCWKSSSGCSQLIEKGLHCPLFYCILRAIPRSSESLWWGGNRAQSRAVGSVSSHIFLILVLFLQTSLHMDIGELLKYRITPHVSWTNPFNISWPGTLLTPALQKQSPYPRHQLSSGTFQPIVFLIHCVLSGAFGPSPLGGRRPLWLPDGHSALRQ